MILIRAKLQLTVLHNVFCKTLIFSIIQKLRAAKREHAVFVMY